MDIKSLERLRKYGYDILINHFEPLLRKVLINEVLLVNYGSKFWLDYIPPIIISQFKEEKELDPSTISIEEFFEEIYLMNLKDIAVFRHNYDYLVNLIGELSKSKFIELMGELNTIRLKIAHAKSTFSQLDLTRVIEITRSICNADLGISILHYVEVEAYKYAKNVPLNFFSEDAIPNNLPEEDYDLDGGFVGRKTERGIIRKLLYSDQDRIVTITGAGGVGKTAVALKSAYDILRDADRSPSSINLSDLQLAE
jgi:LuxR family transcriptional regulator, glucitol operon activator